MGGVTSLYSSSAKDSFTTDDVNNAVRAFQHELTEDDRKLFNFAKQELSKEVAKLSIQDATICIEFKDREFLKISKGESEQQYIRIAKDEDAGFIMRWEKQGWSRWVYSSIQEITWESFQNAVKLIGPPLLAIAFNKKD
ncbi:uncharacterized protein LOC128552910 [Mercenaria mercenaria]|uniref:uncharacterized protein LOC128552910 n=1 Tax=Mercenaria mercenaria TaxID=6596 RepID=UPI00234EB20F|nr:uncharacterized protein LOC128552910 [Mercenaria mercenaria]